MLHPRSSTRSPLGVFGQASCASGTPSRSPSGGGGAVVDDVEVVVTVTLEVVVRRVVVVVVVLVVLVVEPHGVIGVWLQTPPALHASVVQASPSSVHGDPAASRWHWAEQQSPFAVLPSSHCSPASITPLPHTGPPASWRHAAAATEVPIRALTTDPKVKSMLLTPPSRWQ